MKFDAKVISALIAVFLMGGGIGYALPRGRAQPTFPAGSQTGTARGGFTARLGSQVSGGILVGSIAKTANGSLTLSTRDGSSHLVLLAPDTSILKSVAGTTTDLIVGENVLVTGSNNSDGSISAQTIDIRPAGSAPMAPGTNAPMIPTPRLQ